VIATFRAPVVGGGGGGGGGGDGGGGVVFETLTLRDVVAEPPRVSVTLRDSVCDPLLFPAVFQAYDAVAPATVCVETTTPSMESANVRDVPVEPATDIPTELVPLTVAPAAGLENAAVSVPGVGVGGVVTPFLVSTFTEPDPEIPVASRATATSECVPSATIFVSYGIETGPRLAVVIEPIGLPPRLSEYVLDVPELPSSHSTAHDVPLTVVAALGCVTDTFNVPVAGGGVLTFDTVTVDVAVPDCPMGSVAVAVSVCVPLATLVVSHE
jgi:hypothetical protein